jgi:hypothetical protein
LMLLVRAGLRPNLLDVRDIPQVYAHSHGREGLRRSRHDRLARGRASPGEGRARSARRYANHAWLAVSCISEVSPKASTERLKIIASRGRRPGIDRIGGGIADFDAIFFVPDLPIGSAAKLSQSAIRRFRIGMRLFKSATWPSIWLAHGSSSLFTLPARVVGLAGELALQIHDPT